MKNLLVPFCVSALFVLGLFLLFPELETWFAALPERLMQHKDQYALASLAALIADVVLPVPSSVLMYANGYVLGLPAGAALSLVSLLAGSIIGYGLGRFAPGYRPQQGARSGRLLQKYGMPAILLTRGIPVLSESMTLVCGYNRVNFRNFMCWNLLGYLPLSLLYAFCGSAGYDKDVFLLSFGASLLLSAACWLLGRPGRLRLFSPVSSGS